jgi:hypothetical protein
MEYVTKIDKYLDVLGEVGEVIERAILDNKFSRKKTFHNQVKTLIVQDPTGNSVPEDMMPRDQVLELIRRTKRQTELFGNHSYFYQYVFDKDVEDEIMSLLPEEITSKKITLTYQHNFKGDMLTPHTDHGRLCSLFYVMTPPDMRTVWYKRTRDFVIYDKIHDINPDDIEPVFETIMDQHVWYLINQAEVHSGHRLPDTKLDRRTFCIEFNDLPYEEVVKLFE